MTYTNRKKLINNIEEMDAVDNTEMANKVIHKNVYRSTSQLRSGIQSIRNGFKLIRFNDDRKGQAEEPVGDKDAITDIADIDTDNCLLLKTNVEYE